MDRTDPLAEVVAHLARSTPLRPETCRRIVEEVVAAFVEPLDEVLRRRHRELQVEGRSNPAIFALLVDELTRRPVAAPALTERQIRRAIYG